MNTLTVDLSSPQASMALFSGNQCLEEMSWTEERFKSQEFFTHLDQLISRHGLVVADLDRLIAGRGPGNFTGLRISMATLQGLALPHGIELMAISSGYALAWDHLCSTDGSSDQQVTVTGDARRGTCWSAHFQQADGALKILKDWHLVPSDKLEEHLPSEATHLSPEWDRITPFLPSNDGWITHATFPRAVRLFDLAQQVEAGHLPREKFSPIYMHPPVATPATKTK